MRMIALLEKLLKEWHRIKEAPLAHLLISLLSVAVIWTGFHFVYSEKLSHAKDSAAYWKERAERVPVAELMRPQYAVSRPVEPRQQVTPKVSRNKPPSIQASGNGNIQGNTISGNQNVVGNNSQLNVGSDPAPPRKLTDEQTKMLRDFASARSAKIKIISQMGDIEGWNFGEQITDTLRRAGWTVVHKNNIISVGEPLFGVRIQWKGDALPPGQPLAADLNTDWGVLAAGLHQVGVEEYVQPLPDFNPDDGLILMIDRNPMLRANQH